MPLVMPISWNPDDLLALRCAQLLYGAEVHDPVPARTSGQVASTLRWHGLLGLADPSWPILGLDETGRAELAGRIRLQGLMSVRRVGTASAVRDCLDDAGIPGIFCKGFALAQSVWGRASARGAGDIDVIIPEHLLESAAGALAGIGARPGPSMADLRPRALDRRMHHAVTFRLHETEVDVHYRLDPMPFVLPLTFDELLAECQEIRVGAEQFLTFDEEFSLLLIAAGAGRDNWRKWGQVLEFTTLHDRLGADTGMAGRARRLGLGHRFETGLALAEVLGAHHKVSATARAIASAVLAEHARGLTPDGWATRRLQMRNRAQCARSIGSASAYGWTATRLVWAGNAVGRPAEAGLGPDVRTNARRSASLLARGGRAAPRLLDPPGYLCDLVDAAAGGELDRAAFAHLDAALRKDALTAQDRAVLPLLAPLVPDDHPMAGIIAGVRRFARIRSAAAENLVRAVGGQPVVLGDLAAARTYPAPGSRQVFSSLVIVPGRPDAAGRLAARVAAGTGAEIEGGRWPVLVHSGTRVTISRAVGVAFDSPTARSVLSEPCGELVLYDALVRCARGAPAILWYGDVVAAGPVDWSRVLRIARTSGWVAPVVQAMDLLYARGHDVTPVDAHDRLLDELFWNSGNRVARAMLRRLR